MMQDTVRTGTYFKAFVSNPTDFKDKVVLDVGTGSGILAYFAVRAGAKRVYAVEASGVAEHARKLLAHNGLSERIRVIRGKIEEVEIPEKVDVLISEPMGVALLHERMIESYLIGRDRFLKPGGKLMPSNGTIFAAPFTDQALWDDRMSQSAFWKTTDFWGLDLSCLHGDATDDYIMQPVVSYVDPSTLLCATPAALRIDFGSASPGSLHDVSIPFDFLCTRTAVMHGLACWFDVDFDGSDARITLSTGPHCAGTHWYQSRFVMKEPLAVNAGQTVTGVLRMVAHEKYSYNCVIEAGIKGTSKPAVSRTAKVNLQDQHYAYMAAAPAPAPEPDFSISPYASPYVDDGMAPTNHTYEPPFVGEPQGSKFTPAVGSAGPAAGGAGAAAGGADGAGGSS